MGRVNEFTRYRRICPRDSRDRIGQRRRRKGGDKPIRSNEFRLAVPQSTNFQAPEKADKPLMAIVVQPVRAMSVREHINNSQELFNWNDNWNDSWNE